jgi:hypothetical protein
LILFLFTYQHNTTQHNTTQKNLTQRQGRAGQSRPVVVVVVVVVSYYCICFTDRKRIESACMHQKKIDTREIHCVKWFN